MHEISVHGHSAMDALPDSIDGIPIIKRVCVMPKLASATIASLNITVPADDTVDIVYAARDGEDSELCAVVL